MIDADMFVAPVAAADLLYFGNAAIGLASAPVLDAVVGQLRREAEIGGPNASAEAQPRLDQGYAAAARLINAAVDEVAFLESGNRALQSLIQSVGLVPGDHVLVDRTCWGGTLDMLASLPGVTIDIMPVDAFGRADPQATRAALDPHTRLIILTWCPATGGLINPAVEIGAIAAEAGIYYIVDACQMLGQGVVDVARLRCHGLAASGRKWLRGPRATALLYASRAFLDARPAFMADQVGRRRGDARRYESGEAYVAGRIGLGVAIEGALAIGIDRIGAEIRRKAELLRAALAAVPGIALTDVGAPLSGIVTFTVDGMTPADLAARLRRHDVTISPLTAIYAPLDFAARGLAAVARAAPQIYTRDADIQRFAAMLAAVLR